MKRTIALAILLIVGFMNAFCQQDCFERIESLTEEKIRLKHINDSLQKAAKSLENKLAIMQSDTVKLGKQLRSLQSQNALIARYQDSIDILNNKTKEVKTLKDKLAKEVKKNRSVKEEKIKLEQTVKLLKDTIRLKNDGMVRLEKAKTAAVLQAKEEGYAVALNVVENFFNKDFDLLAQIVNRNMLNQFGDIVHNKSVKVKIAHLKTFVVASEALSQRYSKDIVDMSLHQLATIPTTPGVEALRTKLNDYKLCNDALKETLLKIQNYNDKTGKTFFDSDKEIKRTKIMTYLSDYIYNYEFNFTDYPYLAGIVIEVMNAIYRDSDTNIKGIIDKL